MDNGINEERKAKIKDFEFDAEGYLHFTVEIDGYGLEGLFRIYEPANGNSMELVSIDYGYLHPDIANEWSLIENELIEHGKAYYKEFIENMSWERKLTDAMNLLGYERIELDRDSLATVGFFNSETKKQILCDGWDGIYDFLCENIPKDDIKAELVDELIKFNGKIEYYTLGLSNDIDEVLPTFYGEFSDVMERYQSFSAGKIIGIHITEGNQEEHIAIGRYSSSENEYEILEETVFRDKIWNKFPVMTRLLDGYEDLVEKLNYDKAYMAGCELLSGLKDKIISESQKGNVWGEWTGRVVNSHRPQDYVEIDINANQKTKKMQIEVKAIRANEILENSVFMYNINDKINWESIYDTLRISINLIGTDYEYPFKIYSPDIKNSGMYIEHYKMLQDLGYDEKPHMPFTFQVGTEVEIDTTLANMTADEKQAFIDSVEMRRDWSEQVPEFEQKLYLAIIDERGENKEYSNLVGKIEYLGFEGEVAESVSYTDVDEFLDAIYEIDYCGMPASVKIYEGNESSRVLERIKDIRSTLSWSYRYLGNPETLNEKKSKLMESKQTKNPEKDSNFRKSNLLGKGR